MSYISNGRRFTKSALRTLLLSTFRVPSINYSLVCIVSRFIQEAQLTLSDSWALSLWRDGQAELTRPAHIAELGGWSYSEMVYQSQ